MLFVFDQFKRKNFFLPRNLGHHMRKQIPFFFITPVLSQWRMGHDLTVTVTCPGAITWQRLPSEQYSTSLTL